jgi:hypothetical protein
MDVQEVTFAGHRALELTAAGTRMVIVTSVGPRIAWFGRDDNLLYWDYAGEHGAGDWRLYGGHRLWVTRPGADESAEVQAPDHTPCRIERRSDSVRVIAAATSLGIERAISVRVEGARWLVEHSLTNTGSFLWSGGAWSLTCTLPRPDTVYRIPLGGGPPAWDVTTIVIPQRWGGTHTSRLDDPQITFTADAMEIRPDHDESKRMVLAPQGVIEMRDERGLFRKTTPYDPNGTYPLATNLAVYVGPDRFMVEMESMSPARTLPPAGSLSHLEVWTLH